MEIDFVVGEVQAFRRDHFLCPDFLTEVCVFWFGISSLFVHLDRNWCRLQIIFVSFLIFGFNCCSNAPFSLF